MDIKPLFEEFINSISPTNIRITSFPSFIFLCGGPLSKDSSTDYRSIRDFFFKYLQKEKSSTLKHIFLAERIIKLFTEIEGVYKDLLSFEQDLAALSALTVVFVESSGSIAELGSFSVLEKISGKLIIVIKEKHSNQKSFIWKGPVKYLEQITNSYGLEPIFVYNWDNDEEGKLIVGECNEHADDLENSIQEIINKLPKSSLLDFSNPGHVMLLIADIFKIIQIATLREIQEFLTMLSENPPSHEKVKKYVNLLVALNYINKRFYGNNTYFFSVDEPLRVNFNFVKGAKINDIYRWKLYFRNYYAEKGKRKNKALSQYIKSI